MRDLASLRPTGLSTDLRFEVWCPACGNGLCGNTSVHHGPDGTCYAFVLTVSPCEPCLRRAHARGVAGEPLFDNDN
jgi:hypothetical protein